MLQSDLIAANRALALDVARAVAEADQAKRELATAKKQQARLLQMLLVARDEYEANNGRIADGRNPHWSVMVRRWLKKHMGSAA